MDVKCERCSTEYEFDDALVSGRGTTVKCTNCGHKFKIRRSDGDFSEDFWNVTTGDGRTLVFTSLRELQRAIQSYLVERNDRLSRGGLPPKAIGQIPELAPFFEQREAAKRSQQQGRSVKTQDGLGPAAAAAAAAAEGRPRQATKPEFPAPPSSSSDAALGKSTLIGTGPLSEQEAIPAAPEMRSRMASVPPPPTEREPEPSTSRFDGTPIAGAPPAPRPQVSAPPPVPVRRESSNTVPIQRPTPPPPPVPAVKTTAVMATAPAVPSGNAPPPLPERPRPSASHQPVLAPAPRTPPAHERPSDPSLGYDRRPTPPPIPVVAAPTSSPHLEASSPLPPPPRRRSLLQEIEEERDRVRGPSASVPPDAPSSRRRGVGGFVVAVVVLICLATLGAVWAQKNLGITLSNKPPPAPTVDPRVAGFLASGEKALADGNLDSAKESFDKASALSEKDPHVLLGIARLAAARADELWLKSRLLPADAADDHRVTRERLSEMGMGARRAADDALTAQPDDPAALRAKIDALRISGDREGARALVAKINASASQPETAYVLAALDLAEVEPLWPTVIDRLRTAASAETGPGRARAALVFALARSGDPSGAKVEVDRLAAMPRVHPLLPLLRSFADKTRPSAKLDAGVDAAIAVNDVIDAGKGHAPGGPGGPGGMPTDARELVAQGEKARARGDYDRAKTLFTAAVDKNPNDSEALSGLAAIAYAQRDLNGARASYKRVLSINPNYMPALVGLADVEWESGDKAAATKMYKDIIDRYPEGAYPARIKQRAEGG